MEYYNSNEFLALSWVWGIPIMWVVGFIVVYFTVEQKEYVESMTWVFYLGIFWQYTLVFVLLIVFGLALVGVGKVLLRIFTYTMNSIFGGTRGIR
jgi:hypothetical protein